MTEEGVPPLMVPVDGLAGAGYTVATDTDALFVTDLGALQGTRSLCLGGTGQPEQLVIEAPAPTAANSRELELDLVFRVAGFGRVQLDWAVSGTVLRTYRMIVARAVYQEEGAEPEPVGGFFVSDVEQPLFLFENGGIYRATVTVDPVERETFPGLRQSRIIVTDLGTPEEDNIVFDSYRFFTPEGIVPADYTGQSLTITVAQADPGLSWPCFTSAVMLDAIRFARND